ncbi:MAG: peptidoglycan DD-metalloendopeptidase family protein [Candidatus Zixiibacteriota bacterium]|jgi:murein DD-endopeptidase MepM/ murein hydrolase activator NlpD
MFKKKDKNKSARAKSGRMNVMIVPHGGGRSRNLLVHVIVLVFLVSGTLAVLVAAGLMVSDYWKNVIKLSQLGAYEKREREESYKLDVMEKGLDELDVKVEEVGGQYELLEREHRLHEVRDPEDLLVYEELDNAGTLDGVAERVARLEENLGKVSTRFDEDPGLLEVVPSIMPCQGWLYRDFGNTVSPFTGRVEMHAGLDVAAPRGTPVVATAAGVVTAAGLEEHYGLTVQIDHGSGYVTRYAHNMRNAVRVGSEVKRGQVIGYVGSTGRSSCTHVHYEVIKDGIPVNPRYFILREPESIRRPKPAGSPA